MSNYMPLFIRGCNYLSICLFRPAIFLVGQFDNLVHSTSLRSGNSSVALESTERPGLQEDEEKPWNVLEEDTRIEKTHAATEPYFKSDSTSPPPAHSEDQDNANKRPDSLRKRRSVGHRDINKLSNLLSKQQEALDALLNTYVSSSPQEIVLHFQFRQPLLLIQNAYMVSAIVKLPPIQNDHCIIEFYYFYVISVFKWGNENSIPLQTMHKFNFLLFLFGIVQIYSCNHPSAKVEMLSFNDFFCRWLHWNLSKWQPPVQPLMNISSKWQHICLSEYQCKIL